MSRALLAALLVLLSGASLIVGLFALIFAFEGFASLGTHPRNIGLALVATLFLVVGPVSLIGAWVHLLRGRLQSSLRWVGVPFAALFVAWVLAVVAAR